MAKPTFTRRQLGRRMERLREAAGKTFRDVEDTQIIGSTRTLGRLEQGYQVNITYPVIGALCREYGAPDELRIELERMYREADSPGWWEDYLAGVLKDFSLLIEQEEHVSELWIYEPDVITGLLQTEEYARALHEKDPELSADVIKKSLQVRLQRQQVFWARSPLPRVHILMGEAALRGGVDTAQLERITEAASLPEISIRVLPLAGGPYPSMRGPFMILAFDGDDDPDVVYTESVDGCKYDERPAALDIYHRVFRSAHDRSTPIKEFRL